MAQHDVLLLGVTEHRLENLEEVRLGGGGGGGLAEGGETEVDVAKKVAARIERGRWSLHRRRAPFMVASS
jgi:hypothetical protein